jgi:uncharacterized protein YunC (DUF1805 family)
VESCTQAAENIGIHAGMPIRLALITMIEKAGNPNLQ